MTPARALIHQELVDALPEGYTVEAYAPQLDGVQGPVLLLALDTITPQPKAGMHGRIYGAKVLAVHPKADVDLASSEEVDALAEDVLYAIELSPSLSWSSCQRASVDDTWSGWEIQLTVTTNPNHNQE